MREIKFAWVCRNKTFNTIERIELTDTMLLSGARPSWITSDNCEIIAKILPTGLRDKQGKEIYEGDIIGIKLSNGGKCVSASIEWIEKEACFGCRWDADTARIRQEVNMPNLPGNLLSIGNPWEVIGNIYENPELLAGRPSG